MDGHYASFGGVLRDSNIKWLWGYAIKIEGDSIFNVEARGMLEGLFLAWDKGFRRIEVESNNALLVALPHSGGGSNSNLV